MGNAKSSSRLKGKQRQTQQRRSPGKPSVRGRNSILFANQCGSNARIENNGRTARRVDAEEEYDEAVVMSKEPLANNTLFEVTIDEMIDEWLGGIEIGVTPVPPSKMKFPSTLTELTGRSYILSGDVILHDGEPHLYGYGTDLDDLSEGDRVGVLRTSAGEMYVYVNGVNQGLAASNLPPVVYAVVDLYGDCSQVSIIEDQANVQVHASVQPMVFHTNTGSNITLSADRQKATRLHSTFEDGLVLSDRPLSTNEMFEVKILHIVKRWSGSLCLGVITRNPSTIHLPSGSLYFEEGTVFRAGSTSTNDDLRAGERIGIMRSADGDLHSYINGKHQGVVASNVPETIWCLIDLYGKATEVEIVNRQEASMQQTEQVPAHAFIFHNNTGSCVHLSNGQRTAERMRAAHEFYNGVVLTNDPLPNGVLFEIKLEGLVDKWSGSLEIGITSFDPASMDFPPTMSNIVHSKKGHTVMFSGTGMIHKDKGYDYDHEDLDELKVGDRIGVMLTGDRTLHLYINGMDQGAAIHDVPSKVWGVVDIYGRATKVTIVTTESQTKRRVMSSLKNVATVEAECFKSEKSADLPKLDVQEAMQIKTQDFAMVAAIDFGTTFSGYAFSFKATKDDPNLPEKIRINRNWGESLGFQSYKTATSVLTDDKGKFLAFGFEAEQEYGRALEDGSASKLLLYRHFKMKLRDPTDVKRKALIVSVSGMITPALDIFAMSIRYLKDHMFEALKLESGQKPSPDLVRWVITVPAIWSEEAKQFMREAAVKSECISSKESHQLVIALEPEAASLCCRRLTMTHFSEQAVSFVPGTKYMICDCGGGTIDITCHQIEGDERIREITVASGGPWGGTKIDENFVNLMCAVLGTEFMNTYQHDSPEEWLTFMTSFEKVKKSFKADGNTRISIPLLWSMGNAYAQKTKGGSIEKAIKEASDKGVSFVNGTLSISNEAAYKLFDPVIMKIVQHLDSLITDPKLDNLSYILLVGGFGECQALQEAIRKKICRSGIKLVVPDVAQLAVLKGAVLYGHKPHEISTRIAQKTFGCAIETHAKQGKHAAKVKPGEDSEQRKVFYVFVEKGDEIKLGEEFVSVFTPPDPDATSTSFTLLALNRRPNKPVQYVNAVGVTKLGTVSITTPQSSDRRVKLVLMFGETELRAEAVNLSTGVKASAVVDFLSE